MTARGLRVLTVVAATMVHCHEPAVESTGSPAELEADLAAPTDLVEVDPMTTGAPELDDAPSRCILDDELRVLFIGNSFTIGHDVPGLVATLAERAGISMEVRTMAHAGKNLAWHYARPKTAKVIATGEWDVVVLQSRSMDTLRDPDGFLDAGQRLAELVWEAGAYPVLFETWAKAPPHPVYGKRRLTGGDPDAMQARVHDHYWRLAEVSGAEVAEVGEAWRALRHGAPEIDPYARDDNHANRRGAYLTAAVLFAKITDVNPLGNVGDPLLRLDEETAQTLQSYAAEIVHPRCERP